MDTFLSQIPKDLPAWAWISIAVIIAILADAVTKANGSNNKQSNKISGTKIKKSRVNQGNVANDKESK